MAVLDTGVDATHPFLAGKVVSEACYIRYGRGSFVRHLPWRRSLEHVGRFRTPLPGGGLRSRHARRRNRGGQGHCVFGRRTGRVAHSDPGVQRIRNVWRLRRRPDSLRPSFTSDQILGLERVYALRGTFNIAAVNVSLGRNCSRPRAIPVRLKRSSISCGQQGSPRLFRRVTTDRPRHSQHPPAFRQRSVWPRRRTEPPDRRTRSRTSATRTSTRPLFAPGETILSSVPGGGFTNFNGTSMAAPHVAGAWAIMKSRRPSATVGEILGSLRPRERQSSTRATV